VQRPHPSVVRATLVPVLFVAAAYVLGVVAWLPFLMKGWFMPDSPLRIGLYALAWVAIALSFAGWFYAAYANVLRILVIGGALAWLALRVPRWTIRSSN